MSNVKLALYILLACSIGCEQSSDKTPPSAPKARSQAVVADAQHTVASQPVEPPPSAEARPGRSSARKDRELCQGQLDHPGKPLSSLTLEREAAGVEPLPEALPLGGGHWTWLNFWAAWCVPCKEEIPRLMSWQRKLGSERLQVVFVSLDDDARQLTQFLQRQPADGLRRTYWIKEGEKREEWFAQIAMEPDPELPAHVLVDKKGLARCVIHGAVEDGDFSAVQRILGG